MKKQKGFAIIEFLIVVAILGIMASIAIPSAIRNRDAYHLKTYYSMEVAPVTVEEKNAVRSYMQRRLSEHQAAFDVIAEARTKLNDLPPAKTGPEAQERIEKLRAIVASYDEAQRVLAEARRVYYKDLAMEPDPTKK